MRGLKSTKKKVAQLSRKEIKTTHLCLNQMNTHKMVTYPSFVIHRKRGHCISLQISANEKIQ